MNRAKASALATLDANQSALDAQFAQLTPRWRTRRPRGDSDQIAAAQGQLDALNIAQAQLDGQRQPPTHSLRRRRRSWTRIKPQLDQAQQQIDTGASKRSVRQDTELYQARLEYEDGYQEYLDSKAEADQKLADAEQELADGREEDRRRESGADQVKAAERVCAQPRDKRGLCQL